MASKRRNMFQKTKTQETTENGPGPNWLGSKQQDPSRSETPGSYHADVRRAGLQLNEFRRAGASNTNSGEPGRSNMIKFATKRNTPEDADGVNENYSEPTSKKTRPQPQTQQENLTKFSVEIVQQLEFTTSASNSQISTNVTVKALNTSVKSDLTQTSGSPRPPSPRNADPVECKQEPDNPGFVDLEQCAAALEKDAAANGGNSFPGFSDLIGDDTSSDALKDLISWEITDIDPEFMDFNFDGSDSKIQPEPQQLPPQVQPQQRPNFKTEENDLKGCRVDSRAGPAQCRQPRTTRPYGPNLGELSEAELSPAAQTLKQMAEQHQHKTQLAVNFPPKSPYEFQFNNGNVEFVSSPGGAGQQGFKQGTPPCTFTADNIKQEVFSGGRGSPVGYGGIPSPQATRGLGAQFKQQYSPYGSPGAHGSPQYCTRPPQHQQQQQQQQQHQQQHQQQQQQQQPQQQQPPPRPSSGSATLLQVNQAQQLQITQTQGQQIQHWEAIKCRPMVFPTTVVAAVLPQVSMAQNLSAEMKTSNSGGVSVASQQGLYMTGNQESAGTSYCNVSQSQTVNFTQQGFRQRVPPRHQLIRTPHSVR
ncbi:hypothetical protein AAG570_013064 [Ranatra chinensis]|uniref:Uncharacterized protein n=1 Tax=Ranatra chinensis TaxID=642074 RepID=A0ABD0YFP3_9HEMI